jgi:TatD DNase family protein
MRPPVADSHAHLLRRFYEGDVSSVLERARSSGLELVVNVGINLQDSLEAAELARSEPDVTATAGVHPHEASSLDEPTMERLEQLSRRDEVTAVGECGLDYHYDRSPRELQRQALRRQIDLARRVNKPLVLHNRESDADMLEILEQENAAQVGGVMHCFSTTPQVARRLLDMGFHLGFGGLLTFPQAELVRESFAVCPTDRLLLETDCPYLAPVPVRGRRNEPALVCRVLEKAAELRQMPTHELAAITTGNLRRLLKLARP